MLVSLLYYLLMISAMMYLLVIISLTVGLFRIRNATTRKTKERTTVSIIVAVRNEETNILSLLKSLDNQDYPKSLYEIIVINDHSVDETMKLAQDFSNLYHGKNLKLVNSTGEGKKEALEEGFSIASGELLITTDGDCTMKKQWISGIVSFYETTRAQLIAGPVIYNNEKSFLQHFYSFDFMSLVASGAGSIAINLPFMSNAANMAFHRDLLSVSPAGKMHFSGDDVFRIQAIARRKENHKIRFIKNIDSMVYTEAPSNISAFINQRKRWASKARSYDSSWAKIVAFTVLTFNAILVFTFLAGIVKMWLFLIFLLFVLFKLLVDLPMLYAFSGFAGKRKNIYLLPFFEIIYPFYILFSAVSGLLFPFKWKGRKGLK